MKCAQWKCHTCTETLDKPVGQLLFFFFNVTVPPSVWSPPTSTPHTGVLPQHVSPAYSGPLLHLIAFPCRAFTVDLLQIVQYTVYHNFLGLCYILTSQLQLPSITMEITHKRGASGNGEKKTGQRLSNTVAFINCLHEREKRTSIILRSELRFVGCCVGCMYESRGTLLFWFIRKKGHSESLFGKKNPKKQHNCVKNKPWISCCILRVLFCMWKLQAQRASEQNDVPLKDPAGFKYHRIQCES